jgi:hypothetical protein
MTQNTPTINSKITSKISMQFFTLSNKAIQNLVGIFLILTLSISTIHFVHTTTKPVVASANPYCGFDVTVNQSPSQPDPTSVNGVKFEVTFAEPIDASTFTVADISFEYSPATAVNPVVTSLYEIAPFDSTKFEFVAEATSEGIIKPVIDHGTSLFSGQLLGNTGIHPRAILVDNTGTVYTANNGSNDVTRILPNGTSSTLRQLVNLLME